MYKILKANSLINEEQLKELENEGWVLVTIVSSIADEGYFFYFRRTLQ